MTGAHVETQSILSPLERPLLRALAERLPLSLKPDHLTVIGFVGALIALAGGALSNLHPLYLWLIVAGLALNWFGDSLDGTIARHRGIERPAYGYFVDHGCDLFAILLIGLGCGLSPFFSFEAAAVGVIGYLLAMACALLRQHVVGVLQISFAGFGPTEIRLILAFGAISYLVWPPAPMALWGDVTVQLRELVFMVAVFVETLLLAGFMLNEARRIDQQERIALERTKALVVLRARDQSAA